MSRHRLIVLRLLSRIHMQAVVQHFYAEQLFQCGLDLLDAWVAKFEDFTGVGQDDVIVLHDSVALFVLRYFLTELVLTNQVAIDEEFYGVVKGGAAHAGFVRLHLPVQLIDVKMPIEIIDFLQNGKTFRRLAVSVLFEVGLEEIANLLGVSGVLMAIALR